MNDQGSFDYCVPAPIGQSHPIPSQACGYFMDALTTTGNNIPSDYSSTSTSTPGKPSTSTTQLPAGGVTVPGSNLTQSEDNNLVYHSMTGPQLMSWPTGHGHRDAMDAATVRRLMTPLHVITSMGNEHVPVYPPGSFGATAGGGLLKIATTGVQPGAGAARKPQSSAEFQRAKHATVQQHHAHYLPYEMAQKTGFCPSTTVVPFTSGDLGVSGLKRPATDEPAPNVKWPPLKKRKLRTTFSKEQVSTMEGQFQQSMYLPVTTRKQLAQQLGLEDTQVKTWFQNRRMRYKRQHPNEHIAPPSCRSSSSSSTTQVAKPLHCPPAPVQGQFVVPTPPPSVSTPPVGAPPRNSSVCGAAVGVGGGGEPMPIPGIPPSPVYNFGMAPSVGSTDNCCPGFGAPPGVFQPSLPHHPYQSGFGVHQWISTNLFGPQGGAQFPPRHI